MINRIKSFIADHALLADGSRVLVAVSGGADSVCLLLVLHELGFSPVFAHCNFSLRDSESDRDEAFVRSLCQRLNVEFHVRRFDTRAEARRTGKSIEMAARDLRYDWFAQFGLPGAVAHHRDDNAETLLLNLVRGSGLTGLSAMHPSRPLGSVSVVRPLLCVSRAEIEDFLRSRGESFVTDSTNLEDDARRNVVRHRLLPLLAELNPSIADSLNLTAQHLSEVKQIYDIAVSSCIDRCLHDNVISLPSLLATPAPRTVLFEILSRYGFNSQQVDAVWAERDGIAGRVYESGAWRLLRDREGWLLRAKDDDYRVLTSVLPLEGEVRVAPDLVLSVSRHPAAGYVIPTDASVVSLDLERLAFPLTVRFAREGDRFAPFGMTGSRLVSDYLTDLHLSLFDKERQLLLFSGDEIAWVVGRRPSATFAVSPSTRFVLRIVARRTN